MGLASLLLDSSRKPAPEARGVPIDTVTGGSTTVTNLLNRDHANTSGSAAAQRCVAAIARNAASVPVVVEVDGEVRADHPVAALFDRPNPHTSGAAFRETLFARAEWRGEAFVFLDRGATGTGPATAAHIIFAPVSPVVRRGPGGDHDPATIAAVEGAGDVLEGYLITAPNGRRFGLQPSEVLWLRYPHPDEPWGALAPWRAAVHAADVDAWAREWQKSELITGGGGAAVVYLGDLAEDQFTRAKAAWRSVMDGPKSARRHFLTAGPTAPAVNTLGANAADLALIESRRWNLEETCLAFGVPRDYLLGGSTFDNQRTAKTSLWSDTILGKLRLFASEADRQLLPDVRQRVAFDVSEVDALRESEDSQVARLARLLATDVVTVDEARDERGLDPLPGGIGARTLSAYRALVAGRGASDGDVSGRALLHGRRRDVLIVTGRGITRHPATPTPPPAHAGESRADDVALPAAAVLRAYDRHETAGRRALSRLADVQERAVLRAFKKATNRIRDDVVIEARADGTWRAAAGEVRVSADDVYDAAYWTGRTRDALEAWVAATWDDGGATLAARLGVDFDTFNPAVLDAMNARLDVLSAQVTDTTRRVIEERVLAPGVAEGKSVDDLADDLRAVFTDLRTWRAETIARTETVGGFAASSQMVAEQSGLPLVKEWLATLDGRTRDTHAALDGVRIPLKDTFDNGCRFPADPAGPAEETIQCRCVLLYVEEGT